MNTFDQYKTEAQKRWGDTAAYGEHAEKTAGYTEQKWSSLHAAMDTMMAEFAACMNRGEAAESAAAQDLVKKLQSHITENYYRCTNEILYGLGQMYVGDERFKSNIDRHGNGTSAYIRAAITVYCGK